MKTFLRYPLKSVFVPAIVVAVTLGCLRQFYWKSVVNQRQLVSWCIERGGNVLYECDMKVLAGKKPSEKGFYKFFGVDCISKVSCVSRIRIHSTEELYKLIELKQAINEDSWVYVNAPAEILDEEVKDKLRAVSNLEVHDGIQFLSAGSKDGT